MSMAGELYKNIIEQITLYNCPSYIVLVELLYPIP
jgi:hypothetical protein